MNLFSSLSLDGLNERRLTDSDLDAICERDRITVLAEDVATAFYLSVMDRHLIVIPKRLRGLKREFAIWHEIGHHLLHGGRDAGTQAFWYGLLETRNEAEANAFATIALIPRPALDSYDWLEENPSRFAQQLWRDRQRLLFLYGV